MLKTQCFHKTKALLAKTSQITMEGKQNLKKKDIYDEKINNENRINYLFSEVKSINAVYINFISQIGRAHV